ncbi:glutamine dumper 2-like protein [Tanacetum coccineum]
MTPSSSPVTHVKSSLWHSPVPYLFGGLACMMCLIAIALMILACSYWKLNRNLRNSGGAARDLEAGVISDVKPENNEKTAPPFFEEKFLVIMAGELNPTFLATPSSSRTSSFGSGDQQVRNMGSHESNDQVS